MAGEYGENMPVEVGGGSTTYFSDYFYTNIPTSGTAMRGVLFGGIAYCGASAGLANASTSYAATYTRANFGSRLCFHERRTAAYAGDTFRDLYAQILVEKF